MLILKWAKQMEKCKNRTQFGFKIKLTFGTLNKTGFTDAGFDFLIENLEK